MTASRVTRLRCEHLENPLGLDVRTPRLSWQVRSGRRGAAQAGYQVLVASTPELLAAHEGDLWDSGRVMSDACVLVPYAGTPMRSRQRAYWAVRVWDDEGRISPFSDVAHWEMGLLEPAEWLAQWVAPPDGRGAAEAGSVAPLRTQLRIASPVRRARAYVTALGLYELHCNGVRVGQAHFAPGWTDYDQRLQYQVLDLTDLLQVGDNCVGALLADGWYAGYVGFLGQREHYGDTPQLLVQVEVETEAGRQVFVTGEGWSAGPGAILSSDMLMGETVDLRRADPDWCTSAGSTTDGWVPVRRTSGTAARLVASPAPPVAVLQEVTPVAVTRLGPDLHRIDLGQNISGWLRLSVAGRAGAVVTVRHAEVLNEDGSLHTANLRAATATDRYVLATGPCTLEPSFTFHGFRYADVSGLVADLSAADVVGVVCGSDLEQAGTFACSDPRVEQLHSNIVWGARGNFLDIPTDCPQRDERLGWTGDAQVFAPTACFLFDMSAFFTKWLRDLVDTQTESGSFADVAPRAVLGTEGSAGWADAGVLVPWAVFWGSGDRDLLAECYPHMRRWIGYVHRANPGLLWLEARGYDNGDWLAPDSVTDKALIATAFFARSTRITARVAQLLGLTSEAEELHDLADRIVAAFQQAFLRADGLLSSDTQTAYALALRFELLPQEVQAAAGRRLAADVEAHGTHLTTGFLGVAHLLPALSEAGRTDLAYRLLLKEDCPSWLHSVGAGATTIWERWDGWTAEAGFQDPEMNSFNHYAFGAVGEWLYRTVAGIGVAEPGGRRLVLAPQPGDGLSWAHASWLSPLGPVACGWRQAADGEGLEVEVQVPVGATAALRLPVRPDRAVRELVAGLGQTQELDVQGDPGGIWLDIPSGAYVFQL